MGIKGLRGYLRRCCPMQHVSLSSLSGQKLAVDMNVYWSQFDKLEDLIYYLYHLIALLRYHNVFPLFMFDGRGVDQKQFLVERRENQRIDFEQEIQLLECTQQQHGSQSHEILDLEQAKQDLKKNTIHIRRHKKERIKKLISSMGASYVEASGDVVELGSFMVLHKGFWGCLCHDLDLFLYGCPRALGRLDIVNGTVGVYDFPTLLNSSNLSHPEFVQVGVLSGTDFCDRQHKMGFDQAAHYYQEFNALFSVNILETDTMDIQDRYQCYDWLMDMDIIDAHEYMHLNRVCKLFAFSEMLWKIDKDFTFVTWRSVHPFSLATLLDEYGFCFYNTNVTSC